MKTIQNNINQLKLFFFVAASVISLSGHAIGKDSFSRSSEEVASAILLKLSPGIYNGTEATGGKCEVILSEYGGQLVIRGSSYNNPDDEFDCHGVEGSTCYSLSRYRGNSVYAEKLTKNTQDELIAKTKWYPFGDYIDQTLNMSFLDSGKMKILVSYKINNYFQMNECTIEVPGR